MCMQARPHQSHDRRLQLRKQVVDPEQLVVGVVRGEAQWRQAWVAERDQ